MDVLTPIFAFLVLIKNIIAAITGCVKCIRLKYHAADEPQAFPIAILCLDTTIQLWTRQRLNLAGNMRYPHHLTLRVSKAILSSSRHTHVGFYRLKRCMTCMALVSHRV